MGKLQGFVVILLGILGGAGAQSEPLSELALFTRCYTQITGKRPALSHPWRAQIKSGSLTAVAACTALLDKAKFNSSHTLANSSDPEAVNVLNHMNDFHRAWFQSDNLEGATVDTNNALRRDKMMHDETEPALHVTRALFEPNVPFSSVITGTSAMEALRSSGPLVEKTWDGTSGWANARGTMANGKELPVKFEMVTSLSPFTYQVFSSAPLVQTGDLWGVRPMTENAAKMSMVTYSGSTAPVSANPGCCYRGETAQIKVHESLGAGIIGTKTYLMLNLGRPGATFSDGGLDMPRRWAKAVLSDLLCRELPAIRDTDATIYVQGNSKLPFRNGRQCMQCHATIDPLGAIARNVSIRPATTFDYGQWGSSIQLAVHPVELKQIPATDLDSEFYRRPPEGSVLYRSFNGDKVFLPIFGATSATQAFHQLGDALAETDDLYVCAASRYYQLMTGIKVNLQDPGDKASLSLSLQDLQYKNEVISLGKSLKSHKSLRQLMIDIMSSKTYRNAAPAGGGT